MPLLFAAFALLSCASAFNLDFEDPLIFNDPANQKGSYFGYAVGLLKKTGSEDGSWLIVGAPKSNSSFPKLSLVKFPGVAYKCNVIGGTCEALPIRKNGEGYERAVEKGYHEKLENAMIGSVLDIQDAENGNIVVCSPGWKNQYYVDDYFLNGACYTLKGPNYTRENALRPLVVKAFQDLDSSPDGGDTYYYRYGESGFSVQFVKNSSKLIIGAPGVYRWKGSAILCEGSCVHNQYGTIVLNPGLSKTLGDDSYFGYSVSSGKFTLTNTYLYVSGAPRAGNLKGKVFIYDFPPEDDKELIIRKEIDGSQIGEYFGYCLCVVDLNADGLDDLVVGAPLHSLKSTDGDQGKIYIFLNEDNFIFDQFEGESRTTGSQAGGRFGSSLSHLGDLNNDGFSDIAVGAPYEDSGVGAVYIFHGGTKPKFVQKILAQKVHHTLRGFGFSISKGSDIDGNNYSDVAVGAYESGHAVILRSRPIIMFHGSLKTNISRLQLTAKELMVTACISYTGKYVPDTVSAVIHIEVDPEYSRAQFTKGNAVMQYNHNLTHGSSFCQDHEIIINSDADMNDFSKPLKLTMTCQLDEKDCHNRGTIEGKFNKFCPVVDPTSPFKTTVLLPYVTGCSHDDLCRTDIKTEMEVMDLEKPMIIGSKDRLKLKVSVKNFGDPAFLSETNITYSIETPLISVPKDCKEISSNHEKSKILHCEMGNPLKANETRNLMLTFDSSNIHAPYEEIYFKVNSSSSGEDINGNDNYKEEIIPLIRESDLSVFGKSSQKNFYLVKKNDSYSNEVVSFSHIYQIHNGGPSTIRNLKLTFLVPITMKDSSGKSHLLKVYAPKIDLKNINCSPKGYHFPTPEYFAVAYSDDRKNSINSDIEKVHEKHSISTSSDDENIFHMSCTSEEVQCMVLECITGPLRKKEGGVMEFPMKIYPEEWIEILQNYESIRISSIGSLEILDSPEPNQPELSKPDFADVSTYVGELKGHKISPWIVVLAIFFGIILLTVFIIFLKKMGFFKRQKKEELESLKKSNEVEDDIEEENVTGDEDKEV